MSLFCIYAKSRFSNEAAQIVHLPLKDDLRSCMVNKRSIPSCNLCYISPGSSGTICSQSVCLFVCVDAYCPSQEFFSHIGTVPPLPGYYQYFLGSKSVFAQGHNTAEEMSLCSRTQHGGGKYQTPDLLLRSQRLYH